MRRAIVSGKIPPGTPIKEMDISRETGVSRTPVREAVRKLESECLLLRMPGRKLVVTRPNPAEMEEIFLVRSVLEGLAGRIASSKIDSAHIESLKKIERKMRQGAKEKQLSLPSNPISNFTNYRRYLRHQRPVRNIETVLGYGSDDEHDQPG